MSTRPAVVILHYHLRPGGVTRVIERAIESLAGRVDAVLFTSETPASPPVPRTETFEALGYSERPTTGFETLVEELRHRARECLGRDPDVWHVHNHALGKNSFTPRLVDHLARSGCRLLLQPHDFAEDGRPENYRLLSDHLGDRLQQMLYPLADHVWYAPINNRDKAFLSGIGLPHVHELPNAVNAHAVTPPERNAADQKTIVYPARAIRRKNIGEFLLWSLLTPEGYLFRSTLAPRNPRWQEYYNDWIAFAAELELPVEFDAGRKHDFSRLVQRAEALITTSIAEGFGLAFLEPWLEGKSLIGRNLPEITRDFEAEGLDLSALYDTLPIPLEWLGASRFRQALERAMMQSYAAYGRAWDRAHLEQAIDALVIDGQVDFGILDETMQRDVIRHLVQHPEDRARLPEFNPTVDPERIGHNREIVEKHFSVAAYGERLLHLYQELACTAPSRVGSANAAALLDAFLQPDRFNLLRS